MPKKLIQMDNKNLSVEEQAEQAQLQEVKEDEVRASIISEFGFDETADGEKIDKLVAKEVENRKRLSSAIGQKIKHRDEAKKLADELKAKGTTTPNSDLSSKDVLALAKADIHEDDMDRVLKFAKSEGVSVKEALANDDLKAILARRAEVRKTAEATNTGTARRSSVKVSDEEVIAQAEKGQVPEDPEVLARARMNLRKKK